MGQRCSKETGNVKGNGTDSKRPLALPECSASLTNCRGPCAKGLVNTGGWHNRLYNPEEIIGTNRAYKSRNTPSYHQSLSEKGVW